MKFRLSDELLGLFPNLCVIAVVAEDVASGNIDAIQKLLAEAVGEARTRFSESDPKAIPGVRIWREAFLKAGINPNRFPPSIEALVTRILRGAELRPINGAVDLANAISIKHVMPIGAHDLDSVVGDLFVGFTVGSETFKPLGGDEEQVGPHEVAYLDKAGVRTRRWVWRQSDYAKVTEDSRRVFFPIDAFEGETRRQAQEAAAELQAAATRLLNARCHVRIVDGSTPEVDL